jgi:hypothetical protein
MVAAILDAMLSTYGCDRKPLYPRVDEMLQCDIIGAIHDYLRFIKHFSEAAMLRREYTLRAGRLQTQLVGIEDPIAQLMLRALIDALDEAAEEDLRRSGQPSYDLGDIGRH